MAKDDGFRTIDAGSLEDELLPSNNQIYQRQIIDGRSPTINDYTKATHDHSDDTEGGLLDLSLNVQSIYNPYKFSVYRASNQTGIGDTSTTKITFDTENFDTNNNFASNRYTAPVSGFYQIDAYVSASAASSNGVALSIYLYKNGSVITNGGGLYPTAGAGNSVTMFGNISKIVQLAANDYLEIFINMDVISGTVTVNGGATGSYFSGFLVSQT